MRSHLILIWSVTTICAASPIAAPAQAGCSQAEWRLLFDYDARLMRAYDALDWQRYAVLQRQLVAQLSRECLATLDQQHTQDDAEAPSAGLAQPSTHGRGRAHYSVRGYAPCEAHGCGAR